MQIPEQYLPVMPYLIIKNARAFIDFMKQVFKAEEQLIVPRTETVIQHGELRIQDAVIMFADATDQYNERPCGMFIYVESVDQVFERAIKNGVRVLMQPSNQDYGKSAGFEDSFGNQWWITEPVAT